RDGVFHAVHRSSRHRGFSLNVVGYGSAVEIDPGELADFFLLQLPISGNASVRCGTRTVLASPDTAASVLSPTLPTRMRWSAGCEKIIVLVERAAMVRHCEALSESKVDKVEFATGIDLTGTAGRMLLGHVSLMMDSAEAGHPGYLARLGEGIVELMLSAFEHSHSDMVRQPRAPVGEKIVARAEEWIHTHLDIHFCAEDVAAAAGTSLRSLQEGIRRRRGKTLTELIGDIRLDNFRALLLDPLSGQSVTEAALASGLGHLGRAASAYRRRYNETPVETLRRRVS
ncbi:MAG: AraC family transcriptional regulator, partial [Rhizobiaceae bacterium]|nr:AraC family transcriptional regulator [Rhizobiaceae bacterium]